MVPATRCLLFVVAVHASRPVPDGVRVDGASPSPSNNKSLIAAANSPHIDGPKHGAPYVHDAACVDVPVWPMYVDGQVFDLVEGDCAATIHKNPGYPLIKAFDFSSSCPMDKVYVRGSNYYLEYKYQHYETAGQALKAPYDANIKGIIFCFAYIPPSEEEDGWAWKNFFDHHKYAHKAQYRNHIKQYRTDSPTMAPTRTGVTCADIMTDNFQGDPWGISGSRGVRFDKLSPSHDVGNLVWIGCLGPNPAFHANCDPSTFFCHDRTTTPSYPGLRFGVPPAANLGLGAMRAKLGSMEENLVKPPYPSCSVNADVPAYNSPHEHLSVKKLCQYLGYVDGVTLWTDSNSCWSAEVASERVWTHAGFATPFGYGVQYECANHELTLNETPL